MFAVFNKDVKSPAYLSVLVCFLLLPLLANARDPDALDSGPRYSYSSHDMHESYEDYLSGHREPVLPEPASLIKTKKNANVKTGSLASVKKSGPSKEHTFKRYTVRKKDTLTGIARKFGITVSAIRSCNKLKNQNVLKVGMALKIPVSTRSTNRTNKSGTSLASGKKKATPRFRWPVPRVVEYKNDGLDGVKSIGIIITG